MDHVVVLVLAFFFPLRAATFGYHRLVEAPPDQVPRVRRSLYAQALVLQWTLAVLVVALWVWQGRSAVTLGLVPRYPWGLLYGMIAALALGLWLWVLRLRVRRDPEALARLIERIRHVERVLPRTRSELRLFYAVSVTAGICEELLYRGYLLWYFGHALPALPALVLGAAIFGFGHAYQGWRGVIGTTLLGTGLGALYWSCGSLLPPMAIHALTDVHAGSLAQAALSRPAVQPVPESAEAVPRS